MPSIKYRHGRRIEGVYCSFCDTHNRKGICIREKVRWLVRLDCGHLAFRGWTLPDEELQKRGLVNKDEKDPRIASIEKQRLEDRKRKAEEELEFAIKRYGTDGLNETLKRSRGTRVQSETKHY